LGTKPSNFPSFSVPSEFLGQCNKYNSVAEFLELFKGDEGVLKMMKNKVSLPFSLFLEPLSFTSGQEVQVW
jgi:hypothetical protein